jgi:hypothetical protein
VGRLKKLALEYPCQGRLSADDLLRFVTVDMKGYDALQLLAEELLVRLAWSCCVERLFSHGTDIFRPKRRRMYQSTLEALMVLADKTATSWRQSSACRSRSTSRSDASRWN